jgi:predicted RNase H-like nuclease (RuvC/YqgF family)
MMRYAPELRTLLEKAHPRLKHHVARLEGDIGKLQRQIAKLDGNVLTLRSRLKALRKETKKGTIRTATEREDANW